METISSDIQSETIARGTAIIAAFYLTGGLLWYLPSPGYTTVRLLFFLLIFACGWIGTSGVLRQQTSLLIIGVGGLVLLGFWQAVLWMFMLPTATVLLISGFTTTDLLGKQ